MQNAGPGTGSGSLITAEPPGEAASHRTRCAWNSGCSIDPLVRDALRTERVELALQGLLGCRDAGVSELESGRCHPRTLHQDRVRDTLGR
jgi:hypothetical protein